MKSIRLGRANLTNSYVVIKNNEAFIINFNIPIYQVKNTPDTYDALRSRRLLLKKTEIRELINRVRQKGFSLIPLKIFSSGPKIKIELAVAQGLKKHDKRELIKKRETRREIRNN